MSLHLKSWSDFLPKRALAEKVLGQTLKFLGKDPDKNAKYLTGAVSHIAKGEKQEMIRDWFNQWMDKDGPGRPFLQRIVENTDPRVRERYIARIFASIFFRDPDAAANSIQKYGIDTPATMLISPSMRCNYRCEGCYAGSYERKDDMAPEVFDRILGEAEDLGINFINVLGGEPFIYPELLNIIEKHNKSFYQIYTNGSLLTPDVVQRLVKMGNVAPQISINGPADETDAVRGKGAYETCMRAMDTLHEAGCVFGFSSLVTRKNIDVICSDEWAELLIEKGAFYGWLFLYMPVGSNPDMSLMPTPEQRDRMRVFLKHVRETKPLLLVDFWNDGVLSGGCIAGGRLYFHVNHRGDVEPCIFCHFSTDNLHEKSLVDALGSPFFRSIQAEQPFSFNTLRPCPMIDHPNLMWRIIQENGAKPTHEGAEKMFTDFGGEMEQYSEGVAKVMDAVWEKENYNDWAGKWLNHCGYPPNQVEQRKKEYEQRKE